KSARIRLGERQIGLLGELHPLVKERYDLPETPVLLADLDLGLLEEAVAERFTVETVSPFPSVLEDLAVIVDESLPASRVEETIRQAGGKMLADVKLFDV